MNDKEDAEVGRCDTPGCQRSAVMTYNFRNDDYGKLDVNLCLPCRRVIELARMVPWGDESNDWHDIEALKAFREVKYE